MRRRANAPEDGANPAAANRRPGGRMLLLPDTGETPTRWGGERGCVLCRGMERRLGRGREWEGREEKSMTRGARSCWLVWSRRYRG
jgi:hypothetical protein